MPGFADIDRMADPEFFVRSMDRMKEPWRGVTRRTFAMLRIRPGDRLLDVGCGSGDAARGLAALVGPSGHVVGVDSSETMIREAQRRLAGRALPVAFQLGDAARLAFAGASFDGCRAERLFLHLDEPQRALAEMCRVVRPGGAVVVADSDSGTRAVDAPDRALTRKILHAGCDRFRNGWSGRGLYGLFRRQGLRDIEFACETVIETNLADCEDRYRNMAQIAQEDGAVTAAEAADWLAQLKAASDAGHFFSAVTAFIVSGRIS
jgi:SAM-dependent methyltransferase